MPQVVQGNSGPARWPSALRHVRSPSLRLRSDSPPRQPHAAQVADRDNADACLRVMADHPFSPVDVQMCGTRQLKLERHSLHAGSRLERCPATPSSAARRKGISLARPSGAKGGGAAGPEWTGRPHRRSSSCSARCCPRPLFPFEAAERPSIRSASRRQEETEPYASEPALLRKAKLRRSRTRRAWPPTRDPRGLVVSGREIWRSSPVRRAPP